MLGDTVNARAVRILLECNLVKLENFSLDNEYYRLLLNDNWHQREVTASHFQWEPRPPVNRRALTEREFLEVIFLLVSQLCLFLMR